MSDSDYAGAGVLTIIFGVALFLAHVPYWPLLTAGFGAYFWFVGWLGRSR